MEKKLCFVVGIEQRVSGLRVHSQPSAAFLCVCSAPAEQLLLAVIRFSVGACAFSLLTGRINIHCHSPLQRVCNEKCTGLNVFPPHRTKFLAGQGLCLTHLRSLGSSSALDWGRGGWVRISEFQS